MTIRTTRYFGIHSLFLATLVALVIACSSESSDWEFAQQKGSVEALRDFLKRYPEGQFRQPATEKLEDLEFALATAKGSAAALDEFIAAHQAGRHAQDAKRQRDDLLSKSAYRWKSPFTFPKGASGISVTGSKEGLSIRCGAVKLIVPESADPNDEVLVYKNIRHEPDPLRMTVNLEGVAIRADPLTGDLYHDAVAEIKGETCSIPARYSLGGLLRKAGLMDIYPDARNSSGVSIDVDSKIGFTKFAGLKFKQPAVVKISDDGLVMVDRPDLVTEDHSGRIWRSIAVADHHLLVSSP
ncbi:MAG: hypothetical protein CAPSK01_000556 [Candidatus Accumulibacter vicinus]|uniref:Lipoprotein n=2 Tax=Candidatus Accumulibacter vicinus TaxID=2954382 RepID=A0A084Y4S8_9PROT|nr:MAG: hypothetical protein CAPSK01_000556 [Candidatus Accumulibacter vicinus]